MDASVKAGVDVPAIPDNSDTDTVCQEAITELLKTIPTETDITVSNSKHSLPTDLEEASDVRDGDSETVEEGKQIIDTPAMSSREIGGNKVFQPQPSTSSREYPDQKEDYEGSEQVSGTSMSNILYDIGLDVVSDFMKNNPAKYSPKKAADKSSKSKGKDERQHEMKKYYCQECPAYYYELGCMHRHLKNAHKLFIPTEELRNYYRRTTVRRKGSKVKDMESGPVGVTETKKSRGRVEGEETVATDSSKLSTMMNYRCTLCLYKTYNYAKLLLHVQVLHGKAQREQDVICQVSSPTSSFSEAQNPSNLKPVLLLKTENRLDANPSGTDKPVYAKVIPVKKIVLVKKKSRTEDTKAGEVQQFGVKKLEDCIALACPFCEERPECKKNLKNHLKFVHNMDIMEECNKLAQPYPVTNATDNLNQQVQKLGEEEPVVENVSEDKKASTSTGQTQENRLCSGASKSAVKKEEIKKLTVANNPHEGKVSDDEGQEKTENGCTKTENTSDSNTKYKTAYSLSQLMPLVCKLCLQVHVRCVSFVRHMRCAHNIQVHCQEKFDIPLSGQYFNGRDCRFCGFVARDKMTFFVHLGHFHKIVHYAALAAKYEKQSEMSKSECKIVPKSEPLRCLDCGFTTTNASNYQKHRSESHISRQRSSHFKSDQLKNANKKDATDANEDTTKCAAPSTNMRKSVCEECGQTFTYAYERDYHVFKVHKNKQKEEPAWGRRRKPGEPLTTGKSIRKKLCEECGQIFTYAYERDYHVFKVHKNKQKEEPAWGKRRTPTEPLVLEVSVPVKKETDKDVKVSKKCTKRKKKEAKGDKEGAKRVAKSKRRKVEETRLDDGGVKVKVESSKVVKKVAAKKTSTTIKKSSSGCYKHKKKFMPANETTLKEWEHLLKASYACNQYPSREEIQRLAMETGQEFALIRTWFAYERQNQKLGPRPRNVYYKQSTDHTAYMEEELQKNPKPTMQDMSRIAEKTGLSLGLVIYWFKKRVSLTFLDSEEHSPETKSSVVPVSESDVGSVSAADPSSSKDQEQEGVVQLKAPKLDVREVRHRKSRQSRRKGIPKKRAAEEDQTGESSTETKEEAVNNKPTQASDYVKHMTDIDASSVEETGIGRVQKKLRRRRIDELVSKVAARVMSDKGSTSVESMLGTGDWTDQLGSEENEEQPKELDQPETQPCADESPNTSVHPTEKVGQQMGKNPEKIEVKTEVTPMNLKVQRKSLTKIVKQQQQQTLTESAEKQRRLPDLRSSCELDLDVKAKEPDTQSQDHWNDGKPAVKKAKISHQKARALANMIPYYCCLVCDPTPVKSPDKLEATAFTQYTALTQHLRDKHNIRSRFEKLFTIKKFPNVKTNTQEKYQCQYCPIYYHMPGFLVKHLRDQHGVKDQIVKGSAHFEVVKPEVMENMGSGREVKTEEGASDVHPSPSHGRTVTQYCCALCPESKDKTRNAFLQFKSLEDHLMTCHNVTSGFDTYCTSQQVPVLEVSKHDVVTYGKHRCKLCSAQYNYMGFMARHLSEKHELKDLDMKWSDFVEVVTPEMESCSQDSVQKDQSCKVLGKDSSKAESERQLVQEQHSRSSVGKPRSNPSKKPSLSPSSSALDLSLRKRSLSQEQLTSAQSGHIIYQCTLCKSFFRFYTNATDHLGTKHFKYGADCANHIKEMSAKIVEFGRHREQENSSSANQAVNEGSPSLTKKTTVPDQDIAHQMSSLPPESLVGLSNEGDNTDFSTLDISLIDAEGVIYECLTCKAVFPKWALLIRHYECCTWDSSSHLHAIVRMPRELMESFFATSTSGSECSFCYSTIKDQTMLASHLQMHTQPRVLLTCEGDENRKDSDCPIATSAAKIAQYTGTPLSQPETTVSQEETSANKDLNEN